MSTQLSAPPLPVVAVKPSPLKRFCRPPALTGDPPARFPPFPHPPPPRTEPNRAESSRARRAGRPANGGGGGGRGGGRERPPPRSPPPPPLAGRPARARSPRRPGTSDAVRRSVTLTPPPTPPLTGTGRLWRNKEIGGGGGGCLTLALSSAGTSSTRFSDIPGSEGKRPVRGSPAGKKSEEPGWKG